MEEVIAAIAVTEATETETVSDFKTGVTETLMNIESIKFKARFNSRLNNF